MSTVPQNKNSTSGAASPVGASAPVLKQVVVLTYTDTNGAVHQVGLLDTKNNEVSVGIPLKSNDVTLIDIWDEIRGQVHIPEEIRPRASLHSKVACVAKDSSEKIYYHEVSLGLLTDKEIELLKKQTALTRVEKDEEVRTGRGKVSQYEAPLQDKVLFDLVVGAGKDPQILYTGVGVGSDNDTLIKQINNTNADAKAINAFVAETIQGNCKQREEEKLKGIPYQITTLNGRTIHAKLANGQLRKTHATKGREYSTYFDKASMRESAQRASVSARKLNNGTIHSRIADRHAAMAEEIGIMYGDKAISNRQTAYQKCLELEKRYFKFLPIESVPAIDIISYEAADIRKISEEHRRDIKKLVNGYGGEKLNILFTRQLSYQEKERENDPEKDKKEAAAYYAVMKEVFGDPGSDIEKTLDQIREETIAEWSASPRPAEYKYFDNNFEIVKGGLPLAGADEVDMRKFWDKHYRNQHRERLERMPRLAGDSLLELKNKVPNQDNIKYKIDALYELKQKEKDYHQAYERTQYLKNDATDLNRLAAEGKDIKTLEDDIVAFGMANKIQLLAQKRTIEGLEGTEEDKDKKYREQVNNFKKDDSNLAHRLISGEDQYMPEEFKDLYQQLSEHIGIRSYSFWLDFEKSSSTNNHFTMISYLIIALLLLIFTLFARALGDKNVDPSNTEKMIDHVLDNMSEGEIATLARMVDTLMEHDPEGRLNLQLLDEKFLKFTKGSFLGLEWGDKYIDPALNRQRQERAIAILAAIAMANPRSIKGDKIIYPDNARTASETAQKLTKKIQTSKDSPYATVRSVLMRDKYVAIPSVSKALPEEIDPSFKPTGQTARLIDPSALNPALDKKVADLFEDKIKGWGVGSMQDILNDDYNYLDPNQIKLIQSLSRYELDKLKSLIQEDDLNQHKSRP